MVKSLIIMHISSYVFVILRMIVFFRSVNYKDIQKRVEEIEERQGETLTVVKNVLGLIFPEYLVVNIILKDLFNWW